MKPRATEADREECARTQRLLAEVAAMNAAFPGARLGHILRLVERDLSQGLAYLRENVDFGPPRLAVAPAETGGAP